MTCSRDGVNEGAEEVAIDLTDEQWTILEPLIPGRGPERSPGSCRRWPNEIERPFAWLQSLCRILVRHERDVLNYLGFVQLGRIVILLRRCV